jgi:coproporphyrinogen III oxidase
MRFTFRKPVKQLRQIWILSKYKNNAIHRAHRHEARGIGGSSITVATDEMSMENWFNLHRGWNSFLGAYVPIVEKEKIFTAGLSKNGKRNRHPVVMG